MKHIMGNSPKCSECKYYREREIHDNIRYDGWCVEPYNNTYFYANKKKAEPTQKEGVLWNHSCERWIDAEDGLTRYEVETGEPEPGRRECEQELVRSILARAREQQARERGVTNGRLERDRTDRKVYN